MKKFTALILATILMFNFAFVVHAAEEESPVTEDIIGCHGDGSG